MVDVGPLFNDFGNLFGIIFSIFQNVENAPDTTFSGSLAASRPSKTIDFGIDFH